MAAIERSFATSMDELLQDGELMEALGYQTTEVR